MITSFHLFVSFSFWHSFPIYSNSTNSVKAFVEKPFVEKPDDKGWTVEEIVTESGSVLVFKAFYPGKNNTGSKVLFSASFFTQVQVELVAIDILTFLNSGTKISIPFY